MLVRLITRTISGTHEFWYRMTGGLVGGSLGRLPILLLTTTGRKTGKKRTTPLVYLPDGDNMVIIASNGGSDHHPEWWLNLRANPNAEVQFGPDVKSIIAEQAQGAERARLWREVNELYAGYDGYQRSTEREIPVVVLRPER